MEERRVREPREVRTVRSLLNSMGVSDYDEHVVHQLLELLFRHVSAVATEAGSVAMHAGRERADTEDVKLAVRMRCEFKYNSPPGHDTLQNLANEVNSKPLPEIDLKVGVALPPIQKKSSSKSKSKSKP